MRYVKQTVCPFMQVPSLIPEHKEKKTIFQTGSKIFVYNFLSYID